MRRVVASTVAVQTQAARNGHRATRDVRRMRKAQALREGTATPTSQGRRRLKPNPLQGWSQTSLCSRSIKTSRTCTPVALQAAPGPAKRRWLRSLVGREQFRATVVHVATVGPEACLVHSETGQSVVPGRGKVAHQPSHRQVVGSRRCKTEQAKGRLPYLVTRALVLWRSLHAHRLRDKGVGGRITSAGTSSPGAMPKKSTCDYSGCAVRLYAAWDGWPAPVLSARTIQSSCSDAVPKEAL